MLHETCWQLVESVICVSHRGSTCKPMAQLLLNVAMQSRPDGEQTCCACRSLLQIYEPSVLIIVGTNQAIANTGVNQATRRFRQIPLGRAYFDDTKVNHQLPVSCNCHCAAQDAKDNLISCSYALYCHLLLVFCGCSS